ncbi:MAG: hypothetical protein HQK65_01030 [Desulfamplus sp.]|nr:hypothetical protein [Desulfamplus sp.]
MIKEFIIVSAPFFSNSECNRYFGVENDEPLNLNNNQPLQQLCKHNDITFIHPQNPNQPICSLNLYNIVNTNEYFVENRNFISKMNPGDPGHNADLIKTLIFFKESLDKKEIRFNQNMYFKKLERKSLKSGIGETAFQNSLFATHFYERKDNIPGEDVYNCTLNKQNQNTTRLAGWFNPIIIKVRLNGNIFKDVKDNIDKGQMNPATTLSYLLHKDSLLFIEPVLSEEYSVQIEWLEILEEEYFGKTEKYPMSLVESIFWSRKEEHQPLPMPIWKPFVSLDGLRGSFRIEEHGESENGIKRYWVPYAKNIKANFKWYANYWLRKWHSKAELLENVDDNIDIFKSSPILKCCNNHKCNGLAVKDKNKWKPAIDDDLVTAYLALDNLVKDENKSTQVQDLTTISDIIDLYEKSDSWKLIIQSVPELLHAFKMILQRFKGRRDIEKCHLPFLWIDWPKNEEQGIVYFSDLEFIEYFTREYFVPKSKILIKLPENILETDNSEDKNLFKQSTKDRYLELVDSPRWGAALLLLKLAKYLTPGKQFTKSKLELDYKRGWWTEWYESLFSCCENIQIRLLPKGGCQLGEMILGKDELGTDSSIYKQDHYFSF